MNETAMEIINDRIERWHFCQGEARVVGETFAIQLREMIARTGDENRAMRGMVAIDNYIQRKFAKPEDRKTWMDTVIATLSV